MKALKGRVKSGGGGLWLKARRGLRLRARVYG